MIEFDTGAPPSPLVSSWKLTGRSHMAPQNKLQRPFSNKTHSKHPLATSRNHPPRASHRALDCPNSIANWSADAALAALFQILS